MNQDPWGSDHLPILIALNKRAESKTKLKSTRLDNSKTDWEKVDENLVKSLDQCAEVIQNNLIDTQTKYATFLAIITNCITEANPNITQCRPGKKNIANPHKGRLNPAPWWNNKCEKLIRVRKAARLQYKCNANRDNFRKLVITEHNTKTKLTEIKKESFKTFCDTLNKYTNPSYIWKKLKNFKNRWNTSSTANEYSEEIINNVNIAIEQLCPAWVPLAKPDFYNEIGDPFLDQPFLLEELEVAIDKGNTNSSPGIDGIDYQIIKRFPEKLRRLLLALYNEIFLTGTFPNEWREHLVYFIPKNDGKKVRPISLASCLLKTLERMLNLRLCWWLEHHQKLPNRQFGFRRGKSCLDNLTLLNAEILKAFDENEVVAVLSIDIKGAYDNVLPEILIQRLKEEGVPELFLNFVYNLVSFRILTLKYGDVDEKRAIFKGLAQGGVLSSTLYALYMAKLEFIPLGRCELSEFADDDTFIKKDRDPRIAIEALEITMIDVLKFLNDSGLELSPDKCQLCIFSQCKRITSKQWSIELDTKRIKSKSILKLLGIYFENTLAWDAQVEHIREKCLKAISILSYLKTTWRGADPTVLLRLYKALVRSRMEYCGFLFLLFREEKTQLYYFVVQDLYCFLHMKIQYQFNIILPAQINLSVTTSLMNLYGLFPMLILTLE